MLHFIQSMLRSRCSLHAASLSYPWPERRGCSPYEEAVFTCGLETAVAQGGWPLWHDFTGAPENSECAGVTEAVHEFFQHNGNCFHIAKTRFVIHRVAAAVPRRPDPVSGGTL